MFLARSIDIRGYDDEADATGPNTNNDYDRWEDPLFIISIAITAINFLIIMILLIVYFIKKSNYKTDFIPKRIFAISDKPEKLQNWTLKLLMDRAFARYKQTLTFLD